MPRELLIMAVLLFAAPPAAASDPVQQDEEGVWFHESAVRGAAWQGATSVEDLIPAPPLAPEEAGLWLERLGRMTAGTRQELFTLAALHRPDTFRADVRLRLAELLAEDTASHDPDLVEELLRPAPPVDILERWILVLFELPLVHSDLVIAETALINAVGEGLPDDDWCSAAARAGPVAPR